MKNMTTFETWQIGIGIASVLMIFFAAIMAVWIGQNQNKINSRLLQLQDNVAISATPNGSNIAVWNTGNSHLYIWGFDMPGNNQRLLKPRLISKSTGAYYWIPMANLGEISTTTEFEFKLYLTDEYGDKWISENGGRAYPTKINKDSKEVSEIGFEVWSHETIKTDWELKPTQGE